jgi:hypothetical protein
VGMTTPPADARVPPKTSAIPDLDTIGGFPNDALACGIAKSASEAWGRDRHARTSSANLLNIDVIRILALGDLTSPLFGRRLKVVA